MPKASSSDLEKGQTKLPFGGRPGGSGSSSPKQDASDGSTSGSGSASASREGRGRGRGQRGGRGRGRGRGGSSGGGWEARRDAARQIAIENETLHIPALVGAFPKLRAAVDSTVAYSSLPPTTPTTPLAGGKRTRFRFWNCDSYDAAERLVDVWGSEKVAVLNMANAFNPGGGYLNGAMAQEEALCRRSTLFAHISHPQLYPIHLEGGLFSPDVLIFRETNGDIRDSDAYFSVGVVSVAAIDRPRLTPTGEHYADAREEQTTVHKIMAILRIAKLQGQKAIVLGAFGCGAFRNPPSRMATLFLRALTEDPEFTDTFDEVVFAILEVGGSDNMRPWRDVWTGVAEDEAAAATPAADHDAIDEDEDDDIIIVEAPLPVPSAPEPGTAKEGEEAEEGPPAPIVEAGEVVAASSDLGTDSAIPEVSVLTSPYFAGKKS